MLLALHARQDTNVEIAAARDKLMGSKMPFGSGLQALPVRAIPWSERRLERISKLVQWPCVDRWISDDRDWLYLPMEAMLHTRRHPVALTIHDLHALEDDLPWSKTVHHRMFRVRWRRWIGKAAQKSTVIFTASDFTKRRVAALLNVENKKVRVVGNGFRDFRHVPESVADKGEQLFDRPFALVVGGLSARKGGEFVVSVADKLRKCRSDIVIVVVGSYGPYRAGDLALHPNLKVIGAVPDAQLASLYRRAACVLMLSRYEGFGIPAIEGMGSGVPTIVSNWTALPEVVGEGAIVISPDKSNEIAALIDNFVLDSTSRQDWQQRGLKRAREFTWSRCAEKVRETLHELS